MRSVLRFISFAAGAALLLRCSTFGDEGDETQSTDASVDSRGTSSDAADSAPPDASTEGSPCVTSHALCDDFDRPSALFDPGRWSSEVGAATHTIDGVRAISAPSAFLATIDKVSAKYYLQKNLTGPLRGIRCSVWMYLDDAAGDDGYPLRIAFSGGGTQPDYGLEVTVRAKDVRASWIREPGRDTSIGMVGIAAWYHLVIDTPPLRVSVNGVDQTTAGPNDGGPDGSQPFGSGYVQLGIEGNTGAVGWKARFDDVVCDTR